MSLQLYIYLIFYQSKYIIANSTVVFELKLWTHIRWQSKLCHVLNSIQFIGNLQKHYDIKHRNMNECGASPKGLHFLPELEDYIHNYQRNEHSDCLLCKPGTHWYWGHNTTIQWRKWRKINIVFSIFQICIWISIVWAIRPIKRWIIGYIILISSTFVWHALSGF